MNIIDNKTNDEWKNSKNFHYDCVMLPNGEKVT